MQALYDTLSQNETLLATPAGQKNLTESLCSLILAPKPALL